MRAKPAPRLSSNTAAAMSTHGCRASAPMRVALLVAVLFCSGRVEGAAKCGSISLVAIGDSITKVRGNTVQQRVQQVVALGGQERSARSWRR